jgi:hypothetical protein
MMTGITSVTLLAQEIRGAHEKEFFENREAGILGAAEQLWNAFHNCSYGKFRNMESLVPKEFVRP